MPDCSSLVEVWERHSHPADRNRSWFCDEAITRDGALAVSAFVFASTPQGQGPYTYSAGYCDDSGEWHYGEESQVVPCLHEAMELAICERRKLVEDCF